VAVLDQPQAAVTWRVGRKLGRTIYRDDALIGVMDTEADAARVVEAVNNQQSGADILAAFKEMETNVMGALEDIQAADLQLDAEVTALVDEQATFLTDVAAKIAAAGVDPAALAAVTADVTAQAGKLTALADAQRAADPGAPTA
jgi:hypothetical protein